MQRKPDASERLRGRRAPGRRQFAAARGARKAPTLQSKENDSNDKDGGVRPQPTAADKTTAETCCLGGEGGGGGGRSCWFAGVLSWLQHSRMFAGDRGLQPESERQREPEGSSERLRMQ